MNLVNIVSTLNSGNADISVYTLYHRLLSEHIPYFHLHFNSCYLKLQVLLSKSINFLDMKIYFKILHLFGYNIHVILLPVAEKYRL